MDVVHADVAATYLFSSLRNSLATPLPTGPSPVQLVLYSTAQRCYFLSPAADASWHWKPAPRSLEEALAMVHDLVLALLFLAMIIAPAIVTIPPDRDEKDSL
jgi:hypothetical protein